MTQPYFRVEKVDVVKRAEDRAGIMGAHEKANTAAFLRLLERFSFGQQHHVIGMIGDIGIPAPKHA